MTPTEFRAYLDQCPLDRLKRLVITLDDVGVASVELELTPVAPVSPPEQATEQWPGLADLGVRVPQRG